MAHWKSISAARFAVITAEPEEVSTLMPKILAGVVQQPLAEGH
jgi:hypothetical protein